LSISGNVSSHNSGIPEEPVTITIDGNVVATVETEFDGRFFCDWQIDSEVKPGLHFLACCLQKRNGVGVTQYVRVMVKAQVSMNASEKVTAGESLTCTISVCDDHGLPIAGEEISVGRCGLSSKTDAHGNIELLLDTLPFWWGNTNVTVAFQGSKEYLPSTAFAIVAVQPGPVSTLYVLATSALFILGLTLDRGTLKRLFPKAKHDKEELKEISIPTRRDVPPTKVGKRNEVELFVNGERIAKDRSSKRQPSSFSYVFNAKGEHEVMARAFEKSKRGSIEVKTKLRVVDYREEIIRLFKAFLQHLIHQHINLKDDMTAREIEHLLMGGGNFDPESLHKVIDCFERAEYSDHEIGREGYEMMYLSLTGLITDVD